LFPGESNCGARVWRQRDERWLNVSRARHFARNHGA
jgi:hypothetical protein